MGLYNVVQFFADKSYEYVRRNVSAEEAFKGFQHYTTSVGARIGTTVRVIITDDGDCTNAEWIFGKGLVFPTAEDIEKQERSNFERQGGK